MISKKLIIQLIIYSIISYFVLVLPYTNSFDLNTILSLMFLGFDEFNKLNLNKLSISHIVFFMIFLQISFHQMISITFENKTFSSTYQNKIGKQQYITITRKECMNIAISIFFGLLIGVLLIVARIFFFEYNYVLFGINIMKATVYLMKISLIIFVMIYIYSIISIWRSMDYYILSAYFSWVSLIMIDITFGTRMISLSSSLHMEIFYLILTILVVVTISINIEQRYLKIKEIY